MSIRSWTGSAHPSCSESAPTSGIFLARCLAGATLAISMALTVAPAAAQESAPQEETQDLRFYRVEIVIFEQLRAPGQPEDPGRPPPPPLPVDEQTNIPGIFVEQAQPLPQSAPTDSASQTQSSTEETEPEPLFFEPVDLQDLADVARTLDMRPEYRVLAMEAWRQPGFPKERSRPVDLATVARLRSLVAESPGRTMSSPSPQRSEASADSASGYLPNPDGEHLQAAVTLWLGRYLHLKVQAEVATETGFSHLDESRRMRSGEVHYYDSPRLGAITVVIPEDVSDPASGPAEPLESPPTATGGGSL